MAYLCGVLNSELLDLWYAVRGKTPWHVRRNYEPKPMARMPYRHVEPRTRSSGRLAPVRDALATGDAKSAASAVAEIGEALIAAPSLEADALAVLEEIVRAITANRRALLPHRALAAGLGRVVKDPWRTGPVAVDARAMVAAMAPSELVSIRLDPTLELTVMTDGPLGRPTDRGGVLSFKRGRQETARIVGPSERLELVLAALCTATKLLPAEVGALLLPRDLVTFAARERRESEAIKTLLNTGRTLLEAAERLVCRLYGVPPELEDAVVEHAVARAARSQAPAD